MRDVVMQIGGKWVYTLPSGKRYELASYWQRFAARFLDNLISGVILFPGFFLLGLLMEQQIPEWLKFATGAVAVFGLFAYPLLADALPGGQSLGKKVMGTAVIATDTEKPPMLEESLIRNFLGFLSILDFVWILGQQRKRLGDWAASTIVVKADTPV